MTDLDLVLNRRRRRAEADRLLLTGLVEDAAEAGVARALGRLGLADERAGGDLAELRQLLTAWRDARGAAWKGAWSWFARALMALVLLGLAFRMEWGR